MKRSTNTIENLTRMEGRRSFKGSVPVLILRDRLGVLGGNCVGDRGQARVNRGGTRVVFFRTSGIKCRGGNLSFCEEDGKIKRKVLKGDYYGGKKAE